MCILDSCIPYKAHTHMEILATRGRSHANFLYGQYIYIWLLDMTPKNGELVSKFQENCFEKDFGCAKQLVVLLAFLLELLLV